MVRFFIPAVIFIILLNVFGIFESAPQPKVSLNDLSPVNTPMSADLTSGNEHLLKIELDGYETMTLSITKTDTAWNIENTCISRNLNLVIDVKSEEVNLLTSEQLRAFLSQENPDFIEQLKSLNIINVDESDSSWNKFLNFKPLVE